MVVRPPPASDSAFDVLARLVRLSTGTGGASSVVSAAFDACEQLTGAQGVMLFCPVPGRERIALVSHRHVPDEVTQHIQRLDAEVGAAGQAARGAPVAVISVDAYPEGPAREAAIQLGYRTTVGVRVHASGQMTGVLGLLFRDAQPKLDFALLETLGGVIGMAMARDALERSAQFSEHRYRTLVEHVPVAVTVIRNERFEYVNPAMSLVLRRPAEDFIGRPLLDPAVFHPDDHPIVAERYAASMRGEVSRDLFDVRCVRADGVLREVACHGVRVDDERGPAMIAIGVDRTEHNQLLRNAARAQKLHALGTLSGGIAHDFNNLLGTIEGYASLLLEEVDLGPRASSRLSMIADSARRGSQLTARLLNFAQARHPERGPLAIDALLATALDLARPHFHGAFRVEVDPPPGAWVLGDESQLQQVLLNLFINARDAMPGGGLLRVGARPVKVRAAAPLEDLAPGRYVAVDVSDTGGGIPHEHQRTIFEPFWTTKPMGNGTGLGLAMAHAIVTAHGGHLGVRSQPGRGATFSVVLPACDPPERAEAPPPDEPPRVAAPRGDRARPRVLAFDDEAGIRAFLGEALSAIGFDTRLFETGRAALAFLDGGAGEGEGAGWPDVVMMDISIPGEDAVATLAALRERLPDTPILISSGFAQPQVAEQLTATRGTAFLPKPYRIGALRKMLRDLLGGA